VFISQEVTLPLSFAVARTRLLCLTRDGSLGRASGEAFTAGRGDALGFGPLGEVPGASTLVRVQFADPAPHQDLLVLPLRWEAMAPSGRLFPVLDADITLLPLGGSPAGAGGPAVSDETRLVVAGSYRPPSDGLGSMVGTEHLQHVAATTICSLLHHIADDLCMPAEPAADSELAAVNSGPAAAPAAGMPPAAPVPLRRGVRLPHPRRGKRRPARGAP
jgi:hypothetical protein